MGLAEVILGAVEKLLFTKKYSFLFTNLLLMIFLSQIKIKEFTIFKIRWQANISINGLEKETESLMTPSLFEKSEIYKL